MSYIEDMSKPNSLRRNTLIVTVAGEESRPCTPNGVNAVIARRLAQPGAAVVISALDGQVIATGVVTEDGWEMAK